MAEGGSSTDSTSDQEYYDEQDVELNWYRLRRENLSSGSYNACKWRRHRMLHGIGASERRLQKDLSDMTLNPPHNCFAGPKGDNIYEWVATILGPQDSVYEGGVFFLDMKFTTEYPFKPPNIIFRTRIYHCNVDSRGRICLDALNDWSPAMTICTILSSIYCLMERCNPSKQLVDGIANQYVNNRKRHDEIARQWTNRFAT